MFDSMDLKSTVVITFDEWYKFSMDHIRSKTATLPAHPILDHGNSNQFMTFLNAAVRVGTPENTELYWFFLQLFTDADANKDGIVTFMMDDVLVTHKKLGLAHPDAGLFETDTVKRITNQQKMYKKYNQKKKVLQKIVMMMRKRNQTPKLLLN